MSFVQAWFGDGVGRPDKLSFTRQTAAASDRIFSRQRCWNHDMQAPHEDLASATHREAATYAQKIWLRKIYGSHRLMQWRVCSLSFFLSYGLYIFHRLKLRGGSAQLPPKIHEPFNGRVCKAVREEHCASSSSTLASSCSCACGGC